MKAVTDPRQYEPLVQRLAPGSRFVRVVPLKGGISAEMTALEFIRSDGLTEKVIVRQPGQQTLTQNPLAAENEYRLLQITRSLGLPTPASLDLDSSAEFLPTPYLIIEYIEGSPEFSPAASASLARQMAAHLARIHSVDCSSLDFSFLPQSADDRPNRFDESAHPGERRATSDQRFEEDRIRDTLKKAWPLPRRNALALLHGDYWPGNILWQDGRLAAVIDWEDTQVGDPLKDLAISRLDILWIYGMDALSSFTRHYRSLMDIDYTALPYWDLFAALRLARLAGPDLAGWVAFFQPYGRHDITEQTILNSYRYFVNQAFETLEGRK